MSYGDGTLLELFIDVEKRWDTMLDTADVTRQLLQSIIGIFSRKKLQSVYPFLQDIEIKNTRSLEIKRNVTVQQWMLIYL